MTIETVVGERSACRALTVMLGSCKPGSPAPDRIPANPPIADRSR